MGSLVRTQTIPKPPAWWLHNVRRISIGKSNHTKSWGNQLGFILNIKRISFWWTALLLQPTLLLIIRPFHLLTYSDDGRAIWQIYIQVIQKFKYLDSKGMSAKAHFLRILISHYHHCCTLRNSEANVSDLSLLTNEWKPKNNLLDTGCTASNSHWP